MRILSLTTENFRNLKNGTVAFSDKMNVIFGDNAQGKTNLIEAIWLFSGAKSFRGAKDSEMTAFGTDFTRLDMQFQDRQREQSAGIRFGGREIKTLLNNVHLEGRTKLNGVFYAVVFSPAHLSIVAEGPKNRRRFLDDAISQINPQYAGYLRQYEKVLFQRNTLLKECLRRPALKDTIEIWDAQLARLGSILTIYRGDYVRKLNFAAVDIYNGLSREKESFELKYQSTVFAEKPITVYEDSAIRLYYESLCSHLEQDMKQGQTSVGIQRDDLEVLIDGNSAKIYGSQGQKRSGALTLKLAEAALLQSITKETPVILLDDVMSELDAHRQDYILNHVRNNQVFLTCCDISNTLRMKEGKLFRVEGGAVTELQSRGGKEENVRAPAI